MGVIVHNGHNTIAPRIPEKPFGAGKETIRPPASELQHYLKQMTGATIPLVKNKRKAGERPAIVFQLVDRVPGAGTWRATRWAPSGTPPPTGTTHRP